MTQTPAGWFPDPQTPGQQRYWDGAAWTQHVAPAPAYTQPEPTTPDGQPLSGWWRRVGAAVIDGIVVSVVATALSLHWWRHVVSAYGHYLHQALDASDSGTATPSAQGLQGRVFSDLLVILVISLVVNFAYAVGFLAWRQATPGMLALGIHVRLRERPGPMPVGTIALRWLVQNGPSVFGIVPVAGALAGVWVWLDDLWPLWDGQKQALHDKVAGTNVVLRV